jgi:hypothetical protein
MHLLFWLISKIYRTTNALSKLFWKLLHKTFSEMIDNYDINHKIILIIIYFK